MLFINFRGPLSSIFNIQLIPAEMQKNYHTAIELLDVLSQNESILSTFWVYESIPKYNDTSVIQINRHGI